MGGWPKTKSKLFIFTTSMVQSGSEDGGSGPKKVQSLDLPLKWSKPKKFKGHELRK